MAPEPHPPLFAYLPPKIHSRLGAAGSGVWSGIVGMGSGACAFALASAAARNLFFSSLASYFARRATRSSRRALAVARAASSTSSPVGEPSRLIRVG
jgi:hypothetical protein